MNLLRDPEIKKELLVFLLLTVLLAVKSKGEA